MIENISTQVKTILNNSMLNTRGIKLNDSKQLGETMYVTRWVTFISVGVGASQRIPLFWRKTHTKGLRARYLTRLEENEGRKVLESAEGGRTEKWTKETRAENIPV